MTSRRRVLPAERCSSGAWRSASEADEPAPPRSHDDININYEGSEKRVRMRANILPVLLYFTLLYIGGVV